MIDLILQLLQIDDFYGEDESIEIAKGKNEYPNSIKHAYKQFKRERKWQKRKSLK